MGHITVINRDLERALELANLSREMLQNLELILKNNYDRFNNISYSSYIIVLTVMREVS